MGVPNEEPDPGAVPETFQDIQTMIFDPMCAAQCHTGGAAPKGLTLEAGRSVRSLVGVPSVEVPDLVRVAPGQPEDSYLIVKVEPSHPRRIGARMPRTGPPFLSTVQIGALKRWIRAGALEDWVDDQPDAGLVVPPPPDGGEPDAAGPDAAGDGG